MLISVKQAAGLLLITERRVRSLIAKGQLAAWHSNDGHLWISVQDALRLWTQWSDSGVNGRGRARPRP
jgi:hypothetical protein